VNESIASDEGNKLLEASDGKGSARKHELLSLGSLALLLGSLVFLKERVINNNNNISKTEPMKRGMKKWQKCSK
jgi:hypothetical protein